MIFISKDANLNEVLPLLQKDLDYLPDGAVVLRVVNLPLGSLIEVELLAEIEEDPKTELVCKQFLYEENDIQKYCQDI